jgi:hypothetical protein
MEVYEVIGIIEKTGEFKGKDWHNLYIYATSEPTGTARNHTIGLLGDKFKVKWSDLPNIFPNRPAYTLNTFANLVGRKCYIYFDRYGSVTSLTVIPDDKEKNANKPV